MGFKLYFVVPCYNEESILEDSAAHLESMMTRLKHDFSLSEESAILFVDDGSKDSTWSIIENLCRGSAVFEGLKLGHNVGHQGALLAGLTKAGEVCDCAISLDADLQDDIEVLPQFMEEFKRGSEIVYGVRNDRATDSFFKRNSALAFYKLMRAMGCDMLYNHADFRLMSRKALLALAEFPERNLFLRGMIPMIGMKSSIVFYARKAATRPTHYPLAKMLLLAFDGITSFSVKPIRYITLLGGVMCLFSFAMLVYYLFVKLFGHTVPGWTSIIFVSLLLGGVQLLSIGVIGEYIGKIYTEVKRRPRYIEEKFIGKKGVFHEEN